MMDYIETALISAIVTFGVTYPIFRFLYRRR